MPSPELLLMSARNLTILERRRSGESLAAIARSYGISSVRVRQIVKREEDRLQRAAELEEGMASPQQPNILLLPPWLRRDLAKECGKPDFTPQDVVALDYTPALFRQRIPGLSGKNWTLLDEWVSVAGLSLVRPLPSAWRRHTFGMPDVDDER
ncbi:hypothetical protein XI01_16390 [Bradyrhizobium sp. CCBAU 21360]|nr:hypothetical protein [Bradyrhizobium sp. CCBAU 21360]